MSRGIGKTQRRILEVVDASEMELTVSEIAKELEISPRQCRRAVRNLEERKLLSCRRGFTGYRDTNSGPLTYNKPDYGPSEPEPVLKLSKGDPWPTKPGYVAARDFDVYRQPVPAGTALLVSSAAGAQARLDAERAIAERTAGELKALEG